MTEPIAYFNGQLIHFSQVSIPISDSGFVLGTTVAEQLRTFGGRIFRLDEHLDRLFHSLQIVGVDTLQTRADFRDIAREIVERNHALLASGDDLGLCILVTPGSYATLSGGVDAGPTVCVHTYPLPFALWADRYIRGQVLVTPDVRQVSPRAWPRDLKCRSRVHYYLADRQAHAKEPQARALLLDEDGFVMEATTANVLVYSPEEGLVAPPAEKILPGISLATVRELADELRIPHGERDLLPEDVARADEVMLTSTTSCLLPAVRFDSKPIAAGEPGPIFKQLLAAWSGKVGIDIMEQAQRFAGR